MPKCCGRHEIYVLADFRFASSCLTALDTWKALGAIQISGATFADTFYMDERSKVLPGGQARLHFPMKVYRNRSRGDNVPETPACRFDGDMTDDAAIHAWIQAGFSSSQ